MQRQQSFAFPDGIDQSVFVNRFEQIIYAVYRKGLNSIFIVSSCKDNHYPGTEHPDEGFLQTILPNLQ